MTMHEALFPRDDIDRLYVLRKGRRGHDSIEDSVNTSIQHLEDYIKKNKESRITATRNKTSINRTIITKKQKW